MLFLRYLLIVVGYGLFGSAGALMLYDLFVGFELDRLLRRVAPPDVRASVGTHRLRD